MLEKVKAFIAEYDMLKKEDRIIVGVSGGADSICLLFVLFELQKTIPFQMIAVHVNHGLRGEESEADEAYVKSVCKTHQIPCMIFHENVELIAKNRKQSTEEAGRDVRREVFEKTMEVHHGTKIALAHHKNDSVETFLMNLARGTGIKGIGGIKPIAGKYIRPLLCLERREIEQYLLENNIHYCVDSTNASDEYTRNRIRNHVIPYFEKYVNAKTVLHISETMERFQTIQNYMKTQVESCYQSVVEEDLISKRCLIQKEAFEQVDLALQLPLVQNVLANVCGKEKDLEEIHLRMVRDLMEKQVGRQVDLPYKMCATRVYEGVLVCIRDVAAKEKETVALAVFEGEKKCFTWQKMQIHCEVFQKEQKEGELMNLCIQNSGVKYFDYDIIGKEICVRTRQEGDYITIHPDGRTQKLKSFFVNEKIPRGERDEIMLVADGNHILWIVGFRTNCKYHVTDKTKRILKITINEGENNGRDD